MATAAQYERLVALCEVHVWDVPARKLPNPERAMEEVRVINDLVDEMGTMEAKLILAAFSERGRERR